MNKRLRRALVPLLVAGIAAACSPVRYSDDDEICSKAKPLPPIVLVKDEINVSFGDRADCKQVKYFKDAVAKVEYRIGTAFEKHNIKGLLTVYDSDGQVLDQKAVDPSVFRYDFEFDVIAQKPFFVEFKATDGNYAYSSQVRFIKKDPCAKCTAEEDCVETVDGGKACRPKVLVCAPECDEEKGMICEKGECIPACNPPCTRRNYRCDIDTGECVRKGGGYSCSPRCKRGYRCRRGRCIKKTVASGCKGGCKPGTICQANKCVPLGKCPACPNPTDICSKATNFKCRGDGDSANTGPIVGRVASTVRSGQATILYLNRGKRHGVKRGKRGTLCGKYKFVITNAFATRSKAKTNSSIEQIGDCKSVVIKR